MPTVTKRSTIYFDPVLHRALRVKAAETSVRFPNSSMTPSARTSSKTQKIWQHSTSVPRNHWSAMKTC